jgi:hypothetical protein
VTGDTGICKIVIGRSEGARDRSGALDINERIIKATASENVDRLNPAQ